MSSAEKSNHRDSADAVAKRVFGDRLDNEIHGLHHLNDVNLAHVLMQLRTGIMNRETARALLHKLLEIDDKGIAALGELEQDNEGLYLAYEGSLIEELGIHIGGALHTARSRNDLGSTIHRMETRLHLHDLLSSLLTLRESLLKNAQSYQQTVMTGYTHLQPAQPITLGHWMLAIEGALSRDTTRLIQSLERTDAFPLGACALAGTDFPIDRDYTAELLGFNRLIDNSLDAVAARDNAAEAMAACAILATTLSRASTDLHVWYTHEFGYFTLPKSLAGGSSIMPQKKNPVALEILKGRSAHVIGHLQVMLLGQKNTSYSNVVDVNRESLRAFGDTMTQTVDLVDLMRAVVDNLIVDEDRMLRHAQMNFSTVTLLANYLVRERGYSFRASYRLIKELVEIATNRGLSSTDLTSELLDEAAGEPLDVPSDMLDEILDPSTNVVRLKYGAGASPESNSQVIRERQRILGADAKQVENFEVAVESARSKLMSEARAEVS